MVTAAEAECNGILAEALVKQLTGGDRVTARFLHGEYFDFVPAFKLFLAVNHKPIIKGTDHAIWRRVRLIPFDVTIRENEQDRKLPEKLEAERAGILRWLVEGCVAWQRDGLGPPEAVVAATADYRDEMETVGAFMDECCILDPSGEVPAARLRDCYTHWCHENKEPALNQGDFKARLKERGLIQDRSKKGRSWRGLVVTKGQG